jgi:exonuclease SbcD
LHTSLSGRPGHDTYAPTTIDALSDKGYDYFALGHVHAREVVLEAGPRIVFPGNLQGRHAKEIGSKGCDLVTIEGGVITAAEHVSLEVVRWHRLEMDVTGIESVSSLATFFVLEALKIGGVARDKLHAIRVYLQGSSPLHRLEAEQPGTLGAAIQAAAQDVDGVDIWVEEVRLDLRSPFDRATAAAQTDALGEVVRLVDSIAADDAQLKAWFRQHLNEMKEMPPAFGDTAPTALDVQTMHALLTDAEASILVQLSALEAEGKTA